MRAQFETHAVSESSGMREGKREGEGRLEQHEARTVIAWYEHPK